LSVDLEEERQESKEGFLGDEHLAYFFDDIFQNF